MSKFSLQTIITGLLFSILWASASVAGKFGILSVEPLVFFSIRFLLAGSIMLGFVYVIQRNRLPQGKEWKQLTIFGALNTTLYLGLFIIALNYVTPGITTLAIALNPLFISLITAVSMRRRIKITEWSSLALGLTGVFIAAYPLLKTSSATPFGIILIGVSMITYSVGAVYYAAIPWSLSRTTINAWQVFIGGILLLPFTYMLHQKESHFDLRFGLSLAWLIFMVSILAVQLWLRLLKTDAVRASLWLYLCPIFGFIFSALLLHEPLTLYTLTGTLLVLGALYIGQRK
ncbi:MAG TPA: EamA family transporter [Cyclobacteriaceae bacterium]